MIIDPFGEVLAHGGAADDTLVTAVLRRDTLREARLADFNWRDFEGLRSTRC